MIAALHYSDLVGLPYVHRGRDKTSGLDCIGVLLELYRRSGIELGSFDVEYEAGEEMKALADSWPDIWERIERPRELLDVVMVGSSVDALEHVMTYVGEGKVLHTSKMIGVNVIRTRRIDWSRTECYRLCLPTK